MSERYKPKVIIDDALRCDCDTNPSAPLPEEPTAILRHMRTETFPKMIAFYTPVLEYIDALRARLQAEIAKNNYVFEQHDGTKASIADLCNYKKRMEQSESRAAALQKQVDDFCMDYRMKCDEETKRLHMELEALSGVRVPEFTFNELLEFLEEQEDVMDGTDGPRPNPAMRLATDLRALAASKGERDE